MAGRWRYPTPWRWPPARRGGGEPTPAEPERNAGLRWCALDELPERVPPHERAVMDLLAAQLDGGRPVPAITTFGFAPALAPPGA